MVYVIQVYAAVVMYAWVAFLVCVRKQRYSQMKANYSKEILCSLNLR
jgi:hypothetical protein